MKKALRMVHNSYYEESVFERNLKLVSENKDVIDEITLFTEPTHHGYWTLEWVEKNAEILKDRISRYKELGIKRVGINVLCTLGHTEDGAAVAPKSAMQYVTNIDGVVSGSCLCFSDDRFHSYIEKRYELYAKTGADFIWLDDDLRINNHGVVKDYCFCEKCVKKFNEKFSSAYSIDDVRKLFSEDENFKAKWHLNAFDGLTKLFTTIRCAIEKVNSNIDIGFMSCLSGTEPEWIDASGAVLGRPGGGFYNDLTPIGMFGKHFDMQKCIMRYPEKIKDIQYEYESYNFLTLQKSIHISELETSLMILSGCNGMLYNRWNHTNDFLDMLRKSKKKWDVLESFARECKTLGVYCDSNLTSLRLNEIGIAVTPHLENACACFVLGKQWKNYSTEEIEKMLNIGVYTDGEGLEILQNLGFEDLGGSIANRYENGVWEHFTENPLNGDVESKERFVSLDIFHESDAFELFPYKDSQVVSVLNSAFCGIGGCSAYVYKRKNGSGFAADGCLMPSQIQTDNKKMQMTNIFDLISQNSLPVVIKESIKIVPVVSKSGRNISIMLTNAHFDPTGKFEVRIRAGKNFKILADDGSLVNLNQRTENNETVATIDNIGAWQYMLLLGTM